MTYLTAVTADGQLQLGEAARSAGFTPGTVVQVIVTCAGSLILAVDDTPALDLTFRPLTGRAASLALRAAREGAA